MGGHQIGNASRLCKKSVGGVGREMECPHPDLPRMGTESRSLIPSGLGSSQGTPGNESIFPKGSTQEKSLKCSNLEPSLATT